MLLADLLFGRRVDPAQDRIVKFFPRNPPVRGDVVLVNDDRCRVTYARVYWDKEPVPDPKYGLDSPRYRWHLRALRVKRAPKR